MLISLNWLKQYIDIKESVEELKETLTMIGQEVEAVHFPGKDLDHVVIGKIVKYDMHPKSDHLTVLLIDIGEGEPLQIVCGAPNHKLGDKVVVAKIGAVLPGNFKIKKATKRDVDSCGMVCSEMELGVGRDKSGVIILPEDAPVGEEYRKYAGLDDVIFELEITPNRPDCLSYIGIARELAAYYKRKVKYPSVILNETMKTTSTEAAIRIEDGERCKRYMGRVIQNVTIKESPEWLKARIRAMGSNPINNVVDITNFVMFEYNQPLHAFDLDNLAKKTIIIRKAAQGEKLVTLDGVERTFENGELLICDAEKAIALAGVMGGLGSQIEPTTKNILLESAWFDPESTRLTGKRVGLSTDACYRYERGAVDIENIDEASKRATALIAELAEGDVLCEPIDKWGKGLEKLKPVEIPINLKKLDKFIGKDIGYDTVAKIITSLGISIKNTGQEKITVTPPSYRGDLKIPADIYEEVIRMYGFKNIEPHIPVESIRSGVKDPVIALADEAKEILKAVGLQETINYSFVSKEAIEYFTPGAKAIELRNPLSVHMNVMRTNLTYSLLTNIQDNLNRNFTDLRFFEVAKTYVADGDLAKEELHAGIAIAGRHDRSVRDSKPRTFDFYKLKGYVTLFLEYMGMDKKYYLERSAHPAFHPGRSADIKVGKDVVGTFGQIHPDIQEKMDIKKETVFAADFNLVRINKYRNTKIKYESLVKYPEATRDLAVVVDKKTVVGDMIKDLRKASGLIEKIDVFDIYEGENIAPEKMSVAVSIVLRNKDNTLEEKEINKIMENMLKIVADNYGGEIRQ